MAFKQCASNKAIDCLKSERNGSLLREMSYFLIYIYNFSLTKKKYVLSDYSINRWKLLILILDY